MVMDSETLYKLRILLAETDYFTNQASILTDLDELGRVVPKFLYFSFREIGDFCR
jgi:hypothetical protein